MICRFDSCVSPRKIDCWSVCRFLSGCGGVFGDKRPEGGVIACDVVGVCGKTTVSAV